VGSSEGEVLTVQTPTDEYEIVATIEPPKTTAAAQSYYPYYYPGYGYPYGYAAYGYAPGYNWYGWPYGSPYYSAPAYQAPAYADPYAWWRPYSAGAGPKASSRGGY
jgi:hypothetical protein